MKKIIMFVFLMISAFALNSNDVSASSENTKKDDGFTIIEERYIRVKTGCNVKGIWS